MSGFDAVSNGSSTTGDSHSHNHTCTGTNRAIFAEVYTFEAGTAVKPSGMTYNSTALVEIGHLAMNVAELCTMYALANPSSGSNSLVANWPGGSNMDEMFVIAMSTDDTDQTTPNGTVEANTQNTTAPSQTPGTTSGDLVTSFLIMYNQATFAVNGGETDRLNIQTGLSTNGGISTEVAAGATTNMLWNTSGGQDGGHFAFNINTPAAASGAVFINNYASSIKFRHMIGR